jgi:hypothetical protein
MQKPGFRLLMIVCGVLVPASFAWAQTTSGACSDRVLKGDYGFVIEGVLVPSPGVTVPLRGVAMTTFSGDGTLTQVDHVVIPGVPLALDWTPGSGTYHVNPDCTGTAHIDIQTPPGAPKEFTNLRFVVAANGKEIHTVVAAPFDLGSLERTVTSVGIRRDN